MHRVLLLIPPHIARDDRGATSVEYALMAALIALAIFGAGTALGLSVAAIFGNAELNGALS